MLTFYYDLPRGLIDEIALLRGRMPGTYLAVAPHAWASRKSPTLGLFIDKVTDFFREQVERIERQKLAVEAWVNILGPGDSIGWHDHVRRAEPAPPEPNVLSGIYYVTTGMYTLFESGDVVRAEPGKLVVFPATLSHMVPPHAGDSERITLSWNARKEPT